MMHLSVRFRKSLADVGRRKWRYLLVVAGVFINVFSLAALNVTEGSLLASFAYASGYHTTQPDAILSVDQLDPALLLALQVVPNVKTLQYQSIYHTDWRIGGAVGQVPMAIESYPDLAHTPLEPFQLVAGRYPNVGEILMDATDQQAQSIHIGDDVTVLTSQGDVRLRVVGLTSTAGALGDSGGKALGYMSLTGLRRIAGDIGVAAGPSTPIPSLTNALNVWVQQSSQLSATEAALTQALEAHGVSVLRVGHPDVNVNAALVEKTIDGLFSLLRVLVALAVVMSGFLTFSVVSTVIAEQTSIIGVMKTLGAVGRQIVADYLIGVALVCVPATLIGLGLGLCAGYQLALTLAPQIPLALTPFALDVRVVALCIFVGFVLPLLAAFIPIWNGVRLTVRDALSNHDVRAPVEGARWARIGQRLTWVPQITWLGARGMYRKRARAALTLATLTVAGACFLVAQTAVTSIDQSVAASTASSSADISVRFHDATAYPRVSAQIAALPDVAQVEPSASGNISTAWGTLAAYGYTPDTRIYHYQLTSGRWLRAGDTNVILLSDDAARKIGLHVGDALLVNSHTTLTVIGTVHQTISVLGWIGAAILPIATLDALNGASARTAAQPLELLIVARDRSAVSVNRLAEQVSALVNPGGVSISDSAGYFSGDGGTVDTTHEYTARRQRTWYILYYLLYSVALIVGVAGALGLANALISSVADRRREIGVLRALGATGWQVAQVFWVEGVSLGALAWLIGALVGAPLAYAFVQMIWQVAMPIDFHLDGIGFVVMLAAILGIASLASVTPTWRASHMRTADVLRYE